MIWYFIVIVTGVIPLFSSRTSTAELITELPGQPDGVSFKQHSGYIVTDPQRGHALFYYLVEADARDPLSYPLTLWFNGGIVALVLIRYCLCYCLPILIDFGLGPGCSSLGIGAFMEHGPFRPARDGGLMKNEFSWNKVSNVLYVESPIGVGFSYSNTTSDYINWTDADTGTSELFVTIFLLVKSNEKLKCPFEFVLGNPLLDSQISVDGATFLWSHGLISDETLKLKETVCNDSRFLTEEIHNNISKECAEVHEKQVEEMGNFTAPDDVLEPYCFSGTAAMQSASSSAWDAYHAKLARRMVLTDPCLADSIISYLNNPQVQKAIHANTTKLPSVWQSCSGPLSYQGLNLGNDIIPLLSGLIKEHLPVLLYSGDQDSKVPLTQTRIIANMIARDLKFTSMGKYAPWYDKMQVGGWTQSFGRSRKGENATHLTFATVRGAAHEVPYTSPSQALTLFKAFLKGSSLPKVPFKN
ncbi:hypothetical protein BT93_G1834 [Corymbia citriodora subsp. variegata]|nr:hypothetical protein BT93_G1834 [Corymbia citriodora subsp. variegata]